jgi:hypothetical protein
VVAKWILYAPAGTQTPIVIIIISIIIIIIILVTFVHSKGRQPATHGSHMAHETFLCGPSRGEAVLPLRNTDINLSVRANNRKKKHFNVTKMCRCTPITLKSHYLAKGNCSVVQTV